MYDIAKQKIEFAISNKSKELDISNLTFYDTTNMVDVGLSELPESIGNLTQLQEINLSSNQLTTLPVSLKNLKQLQVLDISRNQLSDLPDWIGDFKLRELNLIFNHLTSLPNSIGNLDSLVTLLISQNKISYLPESIGKLKKLRILHLGISKEDNPFKEFPIFIQNFTNLEVLSITGCHIASVPEWISNFANLDLLDLRENLLTTLPSSLVELEKLKKLLLNNNPLIPELAEAYKQGIDGVKTYLRAKAVAQITLNEAKLILVGEGEVGKTCLMDAHCSISHGRNILLHMASKFNHLK